MAIDGSKQGAEHGGGNDEATWLDAHDQAALIDAGECTARELLLLAVDRIERHDPALNAVSHRAFEQLDRRLGAGAGRGAMAGIGWLAKDSLPYVGLPSSFGSRLYAEAGPDAEQFAFADRIDEAGLVALGKSNVPEFSLLPTTESIQLGATSNPWNLGRSAGGSSGGAAAAVAAGLVPVAHAADGGGSIRIPASCCGVVGFKPSREGNLRARGFHLLEDILVSDAMLSRSVRDTAWFARWLRPAGFGTPAKDGPLTIACCTRTMGGAAPDPAVAAAVERTAAICTELGHRVEMLDALPADICEAADIFRTLWYLLARDGVAHCRSALAGRDPSLFLEPWALGLAERAATMDRVETADAYAGIGRVMRAMEAFHRRYDLLLSPVVASPPPALGDLAGTRDFDALEPAMFAYIGYTPLQNVAGTPSISIPLGWSPDGLPIGSMLSGPFGGDETVLRLAAELEAASPWTGKRPLL